MSASTDLDPTRMARLGTIARLGREVAADAENDVNRYERQPFDGKTIAAYQGEQNAMIAALGLAVAELAEYAQWALVHDHG